VKVQKEISQKESNLDDSLEEKDFIKMEKASRIKVNPQLKNMDFLFKD